MKIENGETSRKEDGRGMKEKWKLRDYLNNWFKLPFINQVACCSEEKQNKPNPKRKQT